MTDRTEIIALAKQCGAGTEVLAMGRSDGVLFTPLELEAFFHAAQRLEREACAKVCDARYMGDNNREDMEAKACAAAIRNRGTT